MGPPATAGSFAPLAERLETMRAPRWRDQKLSTAGRHGALWPRPTNPPLGYGALHWMRGPKHAARQSELDSLERHFSIPIAAETKAGRVCCRATPCHLMWQAGLDRRPFRRPRALTLNISRRPTMSTTWRRRRRCLPSDLKANRAAAGRDTRPAVSPPMTTSEYTFEAFLPGISRKNIFNNLHFTFAGLVGRPSDPIRVRPSRSTPDTNIIKTRTVGFSVRRQQRRPTPSRAPNSYNLCR
jgi:hypothetical protein